MPVRVFAPKEVTLQPDYLRHKVEFTAYKETNFSGRRWGRDTTYTEGAAANTNLKHVHLLDPQDWFREKYYLRLTPYFRTSNSGIVYFQSIREPDAYLILAICLDDLHEKQRDPILVENWLYTTDRFEVKVTDLMRGNSG